MTELQIIAVDDLINTLTRVASYAESALYALDKHKQANVVLNGVDVIARFQQIKEEALDAIDRVENGGN